MTHTKQIKCNLFAQGNGFHVLHIFSAARPVTRLLANVDTETKLEKLEIVVAKINFQD